MSRRIADLLIKIGADSYEFQQKTKQVESGLDGISKKLTDVGKNLSLKLTAPLAALGTLSVSLADTQAKAEAKVQQAIESTSGAAQLSFTQLKTYASELQNSTLFSDENILNNATAQLLTFTNIASENFKRTQAVALDLSTVLDGDLKSASIQLGKALNDPVKNLSALSRSGIQFSEEQTEVIKLLAETGRLAEAQSVILDELERQYGGQAEAAAKVGAGALVQLKNSWGDFLEQVGAAIQPALNSLAKMLQTLVGWLQTLSPATLKIVVVIGAIAAAIGPVLITLGSILKILPLMKVALLALNTPITALIGLAAVLAAGFYAAFNSYQQLQNMNSDTAVKWVADGTFKVGDEDKVMDYLEQTKAKLAEHEKYYENSLGGWKNLNADYRDQKELLNDLIEVYSGVLDELDKKKKADDAAAQSAQQAMVAAKKQAEELAASITGVSTTTTSTMGLLSGLQSQIEKLEKQKMLAGSKEEIAEINGEIEKLREQLVELQNIKPELTNLPKYESIIPEGSEPITIPFNVQIPDLKPLVTEAQKQMMEVHDVVQNGIYNWADTTSTALTSNIAETEVIVANYTEALVAKGWKFSEALEYVATCVDDAMRQFDNSVSQFLADSIEATADAIGQVIAGDMGMDGLLRAILTQLASFLKQIGSQLIEFGVMIIAFKSALRSVLANPWAAIAIGSAMVVTAAVMTSLINQSAEDSVPALANGGLAFGTTYAIVGDNPNASIDPEVIAPLSKLKQMMGTGSGGTQNVQIALSGELTAKGRDLVYVLGKESYKMGLLNG